MEAPRPQQGRDPEKGSLRGLATGTETKPGSAHEYEEEIPRRRLSQGVKRSTHGGKAKKRLMRIPGRSLGRPLSEMPA